MFSLNENAQFLDLNIGMTNHKVNFFQNRKIHKENSICHYILLLVICDYVWTILQPFLVLLIFVTTLQPQFATISISILPYENI